MARAEPSQKTKAARCGTGHRERDAERLYARSGWQRAGIIPDYALWPDGGLCDTNDLLEETVGGYAAIPLPSRASRACASGPSDSR